MKDKETLLKTVNLTKTYTNGKGVFNISLDVKRGEIVGFIGPNGAGKSTTMRSIMGFSEHQSGDVFLFGKEIKGIDILDTVIHKIGFLPSEGGMYESVSALELFKYAEKIYGTKLEKTYLKIAKNINLDLNTRVKDLSLGNKKKASFILSYMHNPDLLIMDEPTSSLDPLIQQKILDYIVQVKERDGAVFLSSHILSEVQSICDRIIMIKEGRVVIKDNTEHIMKKALNIVSFSTSHEEKLEEIKKIKGVKKVEIKGNMYEVYAKNKKPIIDLLVSSDIYDFYIEKPSLENMFMDMYK